MKKQSLEKDTNLLNVQIKIKGIGKLFVAFDARSRIEKLFLKAIDILAEKVEEELK